MGKPMLYRVSATVTISCFTDVVARGAEEAAEIAAERQMQGLCHQCSGGDSEREWSLSGELDGEPEVVDAEPLARKPRCHMLLAALSSGKAGGT